MRERAAFDALFVCGLCNNGPASHFCIKHSGNWSRTGSAKLLSRSAAQMFENLDLGGLFMAFLVSILTLFQRKFKHKIPKTH
jgi:hypothetical protein